MNNNEFTLVRRKKERHNIDHLVQLSKTNDYDYIVSYAIEIKDTLKRECLKKHRFSLCKIHNNHGCYCTDCQKAINSLCNIYKNTPEGRESIFNRLIYEYCIGKINKVDLSSGNALKSQCKRDKNHYLCIVKTPIF